MVQSRITNMIRIANSLVEWLQREYVSIFELLIIFNHVEIELAKRDPTYQEAKPVEDPETGQLSVSFTYPPPRPSTGEERPESEFLCPNCKKRLNSISPTRPVEPPTPE